MVKQVDRIFKPVKFEFGKGTCRGWIHVDTISGDVKDNRRDRQEATRFRENVRKGTLVDCGMLWEQSCE